ncbi:MAG: hypothetical protein MI717_02450 [Spirochaetales bacterium]|nr:hypothetical protein [Spirochaetales bacterium]
MDKKRRWILCIYLSILGMTAASAQITIEQITTSIDGNTRRAWLLNELQIHEGKEFESQQKLEHFFNARAIDLDKRRLFREFNWTVTWSSPTKAQISIEILDSFTFLPRPIISYSSNLGLTLGANLVYLNAYGSLMDQALWGYWSPSEYRVGTRLSNVVAGPFRLNLIVDQFDFLTRYGDPTGEIPVQYRSTLTHVSLRSSIPLAPGSPWEFYLEPQVNWRYNYRNYENESGLNRQQVAHPGFSFGIIGGFEWDRLHWQGNQRNGWHLELNNENDFYIQSGGQDIVLDFEVLGFLPVTPWLELSGRIASFYAPSGLRTDAGDRLRGVVDYMTYGTLGVYTTFQTAFRVLDIDRWGELQLRPFVDVGYVSSPEWSHGPESWEYCVGASAIIFIDILPSLALNVDFGWDFKRNRSETIIGTAHFF